MVPTPATASHHASLRVLTNSELKTLRRCSYEHHLAYRLGYRAVESAEALRLGSLLHLGLEAYWRAWPRTANERLIEALAAMAPWYIDAYDQARAEVMLLGYALRWRDCDLEVLGVEVEFRSPLVNPRSGYASTKYVRGGKIDAIVRNPRDSRIYIVEHKTTSEDVSAGSVYWQRLRLDAQVSTYYVGARQIGYEDVAGCIYDVLVKPRLRPLKATPLDKRRYRKDNGELYSGQHAYDETPEDFRARLIEHISGIYKTDPATGETTLAHGGPDAYYSRGDVIRSVDDEIDAAYDAWDLVAQLRLAEYSNRHPRNPEACMRWGRPCDYFGHCTKTQSLDDPALFRNVGEHVHQELDAGQREKETHT
jgi:hypothetical protein